MAAGSLLGVSVLELRTDDAPMTAGLAAAKGKVESEGSAMQKSMDKRMTSMGSSMQKTGSSMSKYLTVPIAGVGIASADMAQKFDQAMEMVHTQAGAPQKEVDNLKNKVLDLAKVLPQSPQQLAEGLFHLESIGLRGANAMNALKIAAQGAAVGNANLEDTATALGSAWLVNIKGAGDLHNVMGVLNATVGAGNMRMESLVDALGTGILPAAKIAGLSLQDVGGAIAVLSDEGTGASRAANLLRTSLHFLYDPTSKAAGALQSIGLGSDALAEDMHKPQGLLTALRDLSTHLNDAFPTGSGRSLSIEQQQSAVENYRQTLIKAGSSGKTLSDAVDTYKKKVADFGTAAVAQEQILGDLFPAGRGWVLQTLMNQMDRYQMKLNQINRTSKNFSQDVAATQQTAAYKIHTAWNTLEVDAINFGNKVLPTLINAGDTIVKDVDKVATTFLSLPKSAQDAIITGGLITAAIGPGLKILGVFTSAMGHLVQLEQAAQKLATGEKSLFGGTATAARAGGAGVTEVASMEVGELIVKSMIGGAGTGGGTGWKLAGTSTGAKTTEKESLGETALPAEEGAGMTAGGAASRLIGSAGVAAIVAAIGIPVALGAKKGIEDYIKGQAQRDGQSFADAFTKPIGPGVTKQTTDRLAKARGTQVDQPKPQAAQGRSSAFTPPPSEVPTPADLRQTAKNYFNEGYTAAEAVKQGLAGVKLTSAPILISDFVGRLKKLPEQARPEAAKVMLTFAEQLEKSGALPKHSVDTIIASLSQEFGPKFAEYLVTAGIGTDRALAKVLTFHASTTSLQNTLASYRKDFGDWQIDTKLTSQNVDANVKVAMDHLYQSIAGSSGKARAKYTAELKTMQNATNSNFSAMLGTVQSSAAGMTRSITDGSSKSANAAKTNFTHFAGYITTAMKTGIIATSTGMQMITEALNSTLKALGQKPLSEAAVDLAVSKGPKGLSNALNEAGAGVNEEGIDAPHYAGGLVQVGRPGEKGRDTVPLKVGGAGSADIVVGRGEKVAVFNDTQQRVMDAGASMMGYRGLDGMFSKVKTPHYLAAGGFVPGFAGGGSLSYSQLEGLWDQAGGAKNMAPLMAAIAMAESTGNVDAHNSSGASGLWQIMMPGNAGDVPGGEANVYNPLDNAIAAVRIAAGGRDLAAWTTYTSGAYRQFLKGAVPPSAYTGKGGAAAAAVQQLKAPTVKGAGVIADIVRATLVKGTAGANAYLSAHAPAPAAGGAGGAGAGANAGVSAAGLPSGVGIPDVGWNPLHKPVDRWIWPILNWAMGHGWHGGITSGYRTDAQQMAAAEAYGLSHYGPAGPLGSNHVKPNYPGGAIDTEDYASLAAVLKGYTGRPTLIWGGSTIEDDVHFSATGHARGGLVNLLRAYAAGGWVNTGATVDDFSGGPMASGFPTSYNAGMTFAELLTTPPRHPKLGELLGYGGSLPFGFPIDVRSAGREVDNVRKIDTGNGQPSTFYTTDLELPAARRLGWGLDSSGPVQIRAHTASAAAKAKPKGNGKKQKLKGGHGVGATFTIPGAGAGDQDIAVINRDLGNLNNILGDSGDVARLGELLSYWPDQWSISNPLLGQDASAFIVTTDALGNPVTPYIDTASVNTSRSELTQEMGWENQTVIELRAALQIAKQVVPKIRTAIAKRQTQIAKLKRQIETNLRNIADLKKNEPDESTDPNVLKLKQEINNAGTGSQSLTSLKQQLATAEKIEVPSGKKGDTQRAARDKLIGSLQGKITAKEHGQKVTVADLRNQLLAVERGDAVSKKQAQAKITGLETQNQQLGGSKTSVGTGGQIGTLSKQVSNLNTSMSTVTGDETNVAGASGVGGQLGPALIEQTTLQHELGQLGSGPLGTALAAAQASAGSSATSDDSQLLSLEEQLVTQQADQIGVLNRQYDVLSNLGNLPPFGGSFATGGTVPGPVGAPRLAIVHGQEEITPPGSDGSNGGATNVRVHLHDERTRVFVNDIEQVVEKVNRKTARAAGRALPGTKGRLRW